MSLVAVAPGMIGCATADAVRVGDGLAVAHARALTATTAIVPAAADEVSAAISGVFARFGTDFHAAATTANGFADQFRHTLAAAATTYTAAEHANTLGVTASVSPVVPLSFLGTFIQAPLLWPLIPVAIAFIPIVLILNLLGL